MQMNNFSVQVVQ